MRCQLGHPGLLLLFCLVPVHYQSGIIQVIYGRKGPLPSCGESREDATHRLAFEWLNECPSASQGAPALDTSRQFATRGYVPPKFSLSLQESSTGPHMLVPASTRTSVTFESIDLSVCVCVGMAVIKIITPVSTVPCIPFFFLESFGLGEASG